MGRVGKGEVTGDGKTSRNRKGRKGEMRDVRVSKGDYNIRDGKGRETERKR